MSKKVFDLTGLTFGRWTVLFPTNCPDTVKNKIAFWMCKCSCGTERPVSAHELKRGSSTSCGCFQKELAKKQMTKHGKVGTPEYRAWSLMIDRCYNKESKAYELYGGRNIQVCDEWRGPGGFERFYEHIGPRPESIAKYKRSEFSIDRINTDGNYEYCNVKWSTATEQARNRRNNIRVEKDGISYTLSEVANIVGVSRTTICQRYKLGWSVEELFEPVKSRRST